MSSLPLEEVTSIVSQFGHSLRRAKKESPQKFQIEALELEKVLARAFANLYRGLIQASNFEVNESDCEYDAATQSWCVPLMGDIFSFTQSHSDDNGKRWLIMSTTGFCFATDVSDEQVHAWTLDWQGRSILAESHQDQERNGWQISSEEMNIVLRATSPGEWSCTSPLGMFRVHEVQPGILHIQDSLSLPKEFKAALLLVIMTQLHPSP